MAKISIILFVTLLTSISVSVAFAEQSKPTLDEIFNSRPTPPDQLVPIATTQDKTDKEITQSITISVTLKGIYIGPQQASLEEMVAYLTSFSQKEHILVMLRADKNLSYGATMQVVGEISSLGFSHIAFVTSAAVPTELNDNSLQNNQSTNTNTENSVSPLDVIDWLWKIVLNRLIPSALQSLFVAIFYWGMACWAYKKISKQDVSKLAKSTTFISVWLITTMPTFWNYLLSIPKFNKAGYIIGLIASVVVFLILGLLTVCKKVRAKSMQGQCLLSGKAVRDTPGTLPFNK